MKKIIAVALLLASSPSFAEQLPGGNDVFRELAARLQFWRQSRQEAAPRGATAATPAPEGRYAAQVACHRSTGGPFAPDGLGGRVATLSGSVNGVAGRFIFNSTTARFEPNSGGAAPSEGAVVSALNAALVDRGYAVDSVDPGAFAHSRCGELRPPMPVSDF